MDVGCFAQNPGIVVIGVFCIDVGGGAVEGRREANLKKNSLYTRGVALGKSDDATKPCPLNVNPN